MAFEVRDAPWNPPEGWKVRIAKNGVPFYFDPYSGAVSAVDPRLDQFRTAEQQQDDELLGQYEWQLSWPTQQKRTLATARWESWQRRQAVDLVWSYNVPAQVSRSCRGFV